MRSPRDQLAASALISLSSLHTLQSEWGCVKATPAPAFAGRVLDFAEAIAPRGYRAVASVFGDLLVQARRDHSGTWNWCQRCRTRRTRVTGGLRQAAYEAPLEMSERLRWVEMTHQRVAAHGHRIFNASFLALNPNGRPSQPDPKEPVADFTLSDWSS